MLCSRLTALIALFVSLFLNCGLNTEVTIAPIILIYLPSDVREYFCWCIFVPGQLRLTALHLACISTYHIITYLKALWRWSCSYCMKNRKRPFTYFLFKYRVRQSSSKERANRKLESRFAQRAFQLCDLLFFKTGSVACGRNTYLSVSVRAGSHEGNYGDSAKCCHMTGFIEEAPIQQSTCIFWPPFVWRHTITLCTEGNAAAN